MSALALIVSVAGAIFSAGQARHAAFSTALTTVSQFILETRTLMVECSAALSSDPIDEDRFRQALSSVMGQFEVTATLMAEGALNGKVRRLVTGTIRDYLDVMAERGYAPYVRDLIDSHEVCENVRDLCLQHAAQFRSREAVFEMLKLPRSSL